MRSNSSAFSKSSRGCGMGLVVAALLTSTSSRPNRSIALATSRRQSSSLATLPFTAKASTPVGSTGRDDFGGARLVGRIIHDDVAAALREEFCRLAADSRRARSRDDRRLALDIHRFLPIDGRTIAMLRTETKMADPRATRLISPTGTKPVRSPQKPVRRGPRPRKYARGCCRVAGPACRSARESRRNAWRIR